MMSRDPRVVEVRCAYCGGKMLVPNAQANGEKPVYCDEQCQLDAQLAETMADEPKEDYGGVLGADGQVHSDADPGL